MKKNTIAIIQARLTSSRFPNKILQKIQNDTIIELLLKRLKKTKYLDKIILAIPYNKKNELLKKKLGKNVNIFSGSENDVLDRYFKAAKKFKAKTIVRICGDCPLIDPKIVDKVVNFYQKNDFDYVSNTIQPTYPDGLDVEVFNFKTLKQFVNLKLSKNEIKFKLEQLRALDNGISIKAIESVSEFHIGVDTQEDLKKANEFAKKNYSK